jgi:hypothetical protein
VTSDIRRHEVFGFAATLARLELLQRQPSFRAHHPNLASTAAASGSAVSTTGSGMCEKAHPDTIATHIVRIKPNLHTVASSFAPEKTQQAPCRQCLDAMREKNAN